MSNLASETIVAYVASLFANIPNATLYRSRQESVQREEGTVINVLPGEESNTLIADQLEQSDLVFKVVVSARGDIPDKIASPVMLACHQALMSDPTLGKKCSKLLRLKTTWQFAEADLNAGLVTVEYRARYMTRVSDGSIVQ